MAGPYLCIGIGGGPYICVGIGSLNTAQRAEAQAAAETLAGLLGGKACLQDTECC